MTTEFFNINAKDHNRPSADFMGEYKNRLEDVRVITTTNLGNDMTLIETDGELQLSDDKLVIVNNDTKTQAIIDNDTDDVYVIDTVPKSHRTKVPKYIALARNLRAYIESDGVYSTLDQIECEEYLSYELGLKRGGRNADWFNAVWYLSEGSDWEIVIFDDDEDGEFVCVLRDFDDVDGEDEITTLGLATGVDELTQLVSEFKNYKPKK